MANEKTGGALATFAASLPALDTKAAAAALRDSSREQSTGGGDGVYMSFSGKFGTYAMGRDKKKPDPDAIYILEPLAAVEGWNCWKGGKPVNRNQWSVYERGEKGIAERDLQDHGPYNIKAGEGWKPMLGIGMLDVDEPSTPISFTIDSISGRNVLSALNDEVADMWEQGEDGIAVFKLGAETFEAQGSKNFKPVVEVLGWVSRAEVEAFMEDDDATVDQLLNGDLVADHAPAEQIEQEPEEEQAPAAEAPTRRRRRAAA